MLDDPHFSQQPPPMDATPSPEPPQAPPSPSPENLSLIKPHRSSDSTFEAIVSSATAHGRPLAFRDFKLIRRVGAGDISTVYLCRLRSDDAAGDYAMKVVDREALKVKNKTQRAEMERKILKMLDHPFLPTMYAEFEASHFSCIVMEYCSGGDLHSLRHKLPTKRFSLSTARFYAAEVLVALEYLHMLGIIYRDLKPENVLVRSDGHIMLSDFDLSLCSDSIPAVQSHLETTTTTTTSSSSSSPDDHHNNHHHNHHDHHPFTEHQHTSPAPMLFSCLSLPKYRLFRSRKIQTFSSGTGAVAGGGGRGGDRMFVAEPVGARSRSFVGTHEYVAPEVAAGGSHGSAVDWWAFGVFLYEMLYGRTPFAGATNEATLRNILKAPLAFPGHAPSPGTAEAHARDLIAGLLRKDPARRLGSRRGAAEVKRHPFFAGMNFALVRSLTPPAIPKAVAVGGKTAAKGKSTAFDYF